MRWTAWIVTAGMALASCAKPPELTVQGAWIRLPAVTGQPGAAYFTVKGGPTTDRLLTVRADYAIRTELHGNMKSGGMTSMKPIETGIEIPVGGTVEFKPGDRHAMLFDIRPGLKPPARMPMSFTFASGVTISTYADLRTAGS